jgi:uncharacterized protein (DUF2141 family)
MKPIRQAVAGTAAMLLIAVPIAAATAGGAELLVRVDYVRSEQGVLRCAVFDAAAGFPMRIEAAARRRALAPRTPVTECRFDALEPGSYAVAVVLDANDNATVDTNLVGMPTEAWAVSRNITPRLRKPRFDEARVELVEGRTVLELRLNHRR